MRGDVRRICQTLAADGYPVHIRVVSCLAPPWDNPNNPRPDPDAEKTHIIELHRLVEAAERTEGFF